MLECLRNVLIYQSVVEKCNLRFVVILFHIFPLWIWCAKISCLLCVGVHSMQHSYLNGGARSLSYSNYRGNQLFNHKRSLSLNQILNSGFIISNKLFWRFHFVTNVEKIKIQDVERTCKFSSKENITNLCKCSFSLKLISRERACRCCYFSAFSGPIF